jgi:hypothetical protein
VFRVNRQVRKCYHLELGGVKRSTLADANRTRKGAIKLQTVLTGILPRASALSTVPGPRNRQGLCLSNQPPGPACPGDSRTLPPPLPDRTLLKLDQAKLADQGLLRHSQECRADPNLSRLDRLTASGLAQVQEQVGLGTPVTQPPGPNHVSGAHGPVGNAWSPVIR